MSTNNNTDPFENYRAARALQQSQDQQQAAREAVANDLLNGRRRLMGTDAKGRSLFLGASKLSNASDF